MKATIEALSIGLKDPDYRLTWIANIAQAQADAEVEFRKSNNRHTKLTIPEKRIVRNNGAELFISWLES